MALRSKNQGFTALVVFLSIALSAHGAERGIAVTPPSALSQGTWGRYHALLVGINDYQQWPKLQTAVKDATVLKDVLVERYNFPPENVTLLLNGVASRRQIMAELRRIASAMAPADNLLIYYAGHGQLDDFTGDGYWIPAEGDLKDPSTWLSNAVVKSILSSERLQAKNVMVIADSCYSGAMLRGGPSLLPLTDTRYMEKLTTAAAKRSRQIISSGGLEPVADGGADGHSLFAYYLIKALRENDQAVIDLENLFHTRVWKPVTEIGNQRPNVGRLKTPMDDDGQFVLTNAAWVSERQARAEEIRRQAEESEKKKAEEADRMAAVQAERQRLELDRQKLEMEKQLMAQKQQLEMQKLELEKQKQVLEMQKLTAQMAAMKQPQPPPPLAAVSPDTTRATRVEKRSTSFAILPMKLSLQKQMLSPVGAANALIDATQQYPDLKVTHSYYGDIKDPDFKQIALTDAEVTSLWKASGFLSDPEPAVENAVAIGKRLGVDYAVTIMVLNKGNTMSIQLNVYLIDVETGKVVTMTRDGVYYLSAKEFIKDACIDQFMKMGFAR